MAHSTWREISHGYCSEISGIELEMILKIFTDENSPATGDCEPTGMAALFRIPFNDDWALDSRITVLRQGVIQQRPPVSGEFLVAV